MSSYIIITMFLVKLAQASTLSSLYNCVREDFVWLRRFEFEVRLRARSVMYCVSGLLIADGSVAQRAERTLCSSAVPIIALIAVHLIK